MTRQTKTPRQRAEEQLAVANRRVVTLERKADQLKADLVNAERDLAEAIARRDYTAADPALPARPASTNHQEEGTK